MKIQRQEIDTRSILIFEGGKGNIWLLKPTFGEIAVGMFLSEAL